MPRLLFILGTRPEAVKLCPVILHIGRSIPAFQIRVCATAQHRGLLDQVLDAFDVRPDYDLDLMRPGQTLSSAAACILSSLEGVLKTEQPDMVVVQGDTTTTFAGALAAFYARVPVAHVEAGLRTGDMSQPFPEEMNRVLTTRLAALHLAPTGGAGRNLIAEGVPPERVVVTGNTAIDAVLFVRDALENDRLPSSNWSWLDPCRKLILVTAHRRENFGPGLDGIFGALAELACRPDVQIALPVHPNPSVRAAANRQLGGIPNLHLLDPLPYVSFVDLMRRAYLLVTDSGGVQEEGPSLGKPILVLREKTERPEAVAAGTVKLVGCDRQRIVTETKYLLDDSNEYKRRAYIHNPYGDGRASSRIASALKRFFGMGEQG